MTRVGLALVAGALAGVNPCGFPLLPAFLSFYVGAEEDSLPRASTRAAQGLLVGLLVSSGFLAAFLVIGVPISYGATQITKAIPWAGLTVGAAMTAGGIVVLSGRDLSVSVSRRFRAERSRRLRAVFAFGGAYALCSLGCTLPVFLALMGASLSAESPAQTLSVFAAYGFGTATILMALSVGAALLRDGLARALKRLLPHMHRISGGLLLLSGAYLSYYWTRVLWAPPEALSDDPFVGMVSRFAGFVQRSAGSGGGRTVVLAAGIVVALALSFALWHRSGPKPGVSSTEETDDEMASSLLEPTSSRRV